MFFPMDLIALAIIVSVGLWVGLSDHQVARQLREWLK